MKKAYYAHKGKNIPIYQIFDLFGNFIIAPFSAFVNPKAKICPNFSVRADFVDGFLFELFVKIGKKLVICCIIPFEKRDKK